MSQFKSYQAGRILSYSGEGQHFCSIQTISGLKEVHPHHGGQFALHSLSIEVSISANITVIDSPRVMFDHISRHLLAQPS